MRTSVQFVLDGSVVTVDFGPGSGLHPTTTVLNFLRSLPGHRGVKEGCAEGDCGACTVVLGEADGGVLRYRAVDSCLLFLPMLHGKELVTVENLRTHDGELHPVQEAMVREYGSQCGFCTPGVVMSLFALYENNVLPTDGEICAAIGGNLCRCTGYQAIIDAARWACGPGRRLSAVGDGSRIVALLGSINTESVELRTERQAYFLPATIEEALSLKRDHPDALVINGSSDAALRVTKDHRLLPLIIDLSGIKGLRENTAGDDGITVGAGTTVEEFLILCRGRFQALAGMMEVFGSLQIRNVATIGGNLGTASPVGDLLPVLIAHRAQVVLRSVAGERRVAASDFVTGYRQTCMSSAELITAVVVPAVRPGSWIRSYKVSKRRDLDIATVSAGFRVDIANGNRIDDVILAYGGMAESVALAHRTEDFLRGKTWNRQTVEAAMGILRKDFSPISDVRGSAVVREIAAKNLLLKFWAETNGDGGAAWV